MRGNATFLMDWTTDGLDYYGRKKWRCGPWIVEACYTRFAMPGPGARKQKPQGWTAEHDDDSISMVWRATRSLAKLCVEAKLRKDGN